MECGNELKYIGDIAQKHIFEFDNKEVIVCENCVEKMQKKQILQQKDNKIEFQYVNIANPIKLGIYIGIGIFIVLPLLVLGVIILLAIFTAIFGYSLGNLFF